MEAMTRDEHEARKARSYKLLLVFAMVSITMMFAGFTSAFVISKSLGNWLKEIQIPSAFWVSTIVIIGCSFTFEVAKRAIKNDNHARVKNFLWFTLALALLFVILQFFGFRQMIAQGNYFTGGSLTSTYIYVFAIMHLAHLFGGLIALARIIYNHFKKKYSSRQMVGIELGAMYWHFLDGLWLYLFLFLNFFK
jgi:cytochrome c oxidase subunit 3